MAVISITIPDAVIGRVTDAYAAEYGYQATITNPDGTTSPNPQTKAQFTKQQVINQIRQTVRNHEANEAAATARQTKEADVNSWSLT